MKSTVRNIALAIHHFTQPCFCKVIAIFMLLLAFQKSNAQTPYNPGKLAVLVVGDGSAALSGSATPVFVKEFNITGAGQLGTLRTSFPTVAVSGTSSVNRALTQSGSGTSEGFIGLSTNRQFLLVTGYNSTNGSATVSSSVATTFPTNTRVIAKIDATGVADTKSTLFTSNSGSAIRSAASVDGTGYWTTGALGMFYVLNGNVAAPTNLTLTNTRVTSIFNNQLYSSSGAAGFRMATLGTGLPTSGSPVLTNLNGFLTSTGDPYSHLFLDLNGGGPDVLYIASLSAAPSGLLKYTSSNNGATWSAAGSILGNVFGVTGVFNSCTGNVDLYITANTTNAKPNTLYRISDLNVTAGSPANITNNGLALNTFGTLLATAATNTAFGGVAFTPGTTLTTPSLYNVTGGNTCFGSDISIGLSNSETGINYEFKKDGVTISTLPGTGVPLSFGNQSDAGVYSVVATNPLTGCTSNMVGSSVINALPSVNITASSSSICAGETTNINLDFTGTGPWTYSINSSATVSTNNNPEVIPVSPSDTTTYSIKTFSDANCNGILWTNISTGAYHSLAIKADGTLWSWGNNEDGQLGIGTNIDTNIAVQIGTASNWVKIATTANSSYAIKADGTLWAWGENFYGQLGIGSNVNSNVPLQVGTDIDWIEIAGGNLHCLAIKANGTLWAWGLNLSSQLGDGSTISRNTPVQIGSQTDWVEISAGTSHSIARRSNGRISTWGSNTYGQTGNGSASSVPVQLSGGNNWISISAGAEFCIAMKSDGSLHVWGRNSLGQLGIGTYVDLNTPFQLSGPLNWAKVSASSAHTLAIKADGTLWAWGYNPLGAFGNGTNTSSNVPVQVGSETDWAEVSTGLDNSTALKTNKSLWNWGRNNQGQLGDGTNTNKLSPVQIVNYFGSVTIAVNPLPVVNFSGLLPVYCANAEPVILIGSPAGGTFSGPGIIGNSFNPALAGAGSGFTITYSYTNVETGCIGSISQNVSVTALPIVFYTGLASVYCVTPLAVTLIGFPSGGTFSGPGISGNVFDPATAGTGGPYTITYSYTDIATGCSNTASQLVTVGTFPTVSISGNDFVCFEGTALLTATANPVNGSITSYQWIRTTLSGSTNLGTASTQLINSGGDYTVIVTNSFGCSITSAVFKVIAYAFPDISFSGLASQYCVNASSVTLQGYLFGNPLPGGTFSGPGITDNGNGTAIFNPVTAGAGGPYTIIYSYTIPGTTCSNSISQNVTVNALPVVSIVELASEYCINALPVNLTGSPAGGTFSGPGITGNTFYPATVGAGGPYTITYSYTNITTGCSNNISQNVTVNGLPTVSISASPNTICPGSTANLILNFTGTGPWSYSINGATPVSTSSNPETVPVNPSLTTIYNLTSFNDANCSLNEWLTMSTGSYHSLAIKTDGTLWAWGRNNQNGQLGNGTIADSNTPIKIGTSTNWTKLATGAVHSLAIKTDGTLWAWGANDFGQLGDTTTIKKTSPIQIGLSNDWAKIDGGHLYSLAIKTDGTLWAWGQNNSGQLGDGTSIGKTFPVQIGVSTDWVEISGGLDHSLAIKSNGTLWAWGTSVFGQAGGAASNVPIQVGTSNDWASIFAGQYYSLGIKTGGTLWAWGRNDLGQLGNGFYFQLNSPTQIGSETNWFKISGHSAHSLGLKQNGTLWAWGLNNDGQLGNGTITSTNTPAQIGTAANWTSISAGLNDSHGINTGGMIWSWGINDFGQLGDNTNISKTSPVQVNTTITSVTVTVNPLPVVSFSGLALNYCVNASPVTLTGSPAGGTFSGPGISGNVFNPAVAGVSLGVPHVISYLYTDIATGCSNSISQSVIVYPLPVVSIAGLATQYCINASPVTLTGSPAGGSFSGTGISGNTFNAAIAGVGGPYMITYSYTDILTGCSNTASQLVTVGTFPSVSISGNNFVCFGGNALLTATATPVNGTITGYQWIRTTLSGSTNLGTASTQIINSGGDYTVIVTNSFGCSISSAVFNVTAYAESAISFSGLASQYCLNAPAVTFQGYLFGNPAQDGTFSGPGITDNGNGTALFNPVTAGVGGPYTIIYSNTIPGTTCNYSVSQNVTVNALPIVSFSGLPSVYCANDPALTLTGSPAGGIFSGPGITGNTFNPAVAGTGGPYIITYTYTDPVTGCSNTSANSITLSCAEALVFDGVNDNVALPNSLAVSATAPSNTAITIEYWFKGSNVHSAVRLQDDNGYIVAGWSSLGQPIHIISTDNGINGIGINPIVNNGNWHHVAMTWEKNTINGFKSYVDGQLYTQRNSANANLPLISSGANLGSYRSVGEFMNGQLDEVRIWNRALCQEEIQSRMNCEIPGAEAGLLANYHFNHGVAGSINAGINSLSDASTNNYNGTLNNFALSGTVSNWVAPGAVVSGVSCSGIIAAQEINVQGNAVSIADNSITPTVTDHTDFGNVISGGSLVRTFTIQNTGTASLAISGISMTGINQSMFTIGSLSPALSITAGNSATFTVTFSATSLGTKTATVVIYNNDCNESVYDFSVEALSECPAVSFTGLAATYCSNAPSVTLTGNPIGGIFSGPGITGNVFDPANAGVGTHNIQYTYSDGYGCSNSETKQVVVSICTPAYTTLNLTAFLEGFYYDINTMRANIYDLGISTDPAETDTVTVNLWAPASLVNSEPDHTVKAVLHTDGNATMQFPSALIGNEFYIAVKHRNHLETWSKLPVTFSSNTDYDFTDSLQKAYDDGVNPPMSAVAGNKFAFYGGNVNQDGTVDASDMADVDNDNAVFAFGYNATDASGDGTTDASDISIVDNNQSLFLFYARPY